MKTKLLSLFFFLALMLCVRESHAALTLAITTTAGSCPASGQINIVASGGTGGFWYTYKYTKNCPGMPPVIFQAPQTANNTYTFTGLEACSYTITVTKGTQSASQTVTVTNAYTPLGFNSTTINGCCLTANPTGGKQPYSYAIRALTALPTSFSATQTSPSFCNLLPAVYDIRIYDACQNFITTSAIISANPLVLPPPTCTPNGNTKYDVTVQPPLNGTSPYTYSWISGSDILIDSTGIFTGLSKCTYKIIAVDACRNTDTLDNLSACIAAPSLSLVDVNCSAGTLNVAVMGGNAPYNFWVNTPANVNNTGNFTALPTGIGTYNVFVQDQCLKRDTLAVTCMSSDSVTYSCSPQCNFKTNITLCGKTTSPNAYPLTYTCLTCSSSIIMTQPTANSCVTFLNLPSGNHTFNVQDAFGTTFTKNVSCNVDTLKLAGVYHYSCSGSVTFSVLNQDVFYPIIIKCLDCSNLTPDTVLSFPFTFVGADPGWHKFQFTDTCGFSKIDSINCLLDTLDASLTYVGGCGGEVTFSLVNNGNIQFPVTYTCLTSNVSVTSFSLTTVLPNIFPGNHTFSITDACGNGIIKNYNCVMPPLTVTGEWIEGCPGELLLHIPSTYPVKTLTAHCNNCGHPNITTTLTNNNNTIHFPNVSAGIDTFVVSDSCGNIDYYFFNKTLSPLSATITHKNVCPDTLTLIPSANMVFYPVSVIVNHTDTISVNAGNLVKNSLCMGIYTFDLSDQCRTIQIIDTLENEPLAGNVNSVWHTGCPGSITSTPDTATLCFPLRYECVECAANNVQFGARNEMITWANVGVGTYHIKITDDCGHDSLFTTIVASDVPMTATVSHTSVCPTSLIILPDASTFAYPLTAICDSCPPSQDSITVNSGNPVFTGVCTGTYHIKLIDACGDTLLLTHTILPQNPINTAVWNPGCKGSVTFELKTSACKAITYKCITCTDTTSQISSATPYTFANVNAGMNVFQIKDFCGNIFFDTLACYNPTPIVTIRDSSICPHILSLEPDFASILLPFTYTNLAQPNIVDTTGIFPNLCQGFYLFEVSNTCGEKDTFDYTIPTYNLGLVAVFDSAACPNGLSYHFTHPSGKPICYPVAVHCDTCGVGGADIDALIYTSTFALTGIFPDIHDFTLTDACGNVTNLILYDTLTPLKMQISCSSGCPGSVSFKNVSSIISTPFYITGVGCGSLGQDTTIISNDTTKTWVGIGPGTHTYKIIDNCGRRLTKTDSCVVNTLTITAEPKGCDAFEITTSPNILSSLQMFQATSVVDPNTYFFSNGNSNLITPVSQGTYEITVANTYGCILKPDTVTTNWANFILYQVTPAGNIMWESNYTGIFTNIPSGSYQIVHFLCGTGPGPGLLFFLSSIGTTCSTIQLQSSPSYDVVYELREDPLAVAPLATYTTTANNTTALFSNLQVAKEYFIDLTYYPNPADSSIVYKLNSSIYTDSMPELTTNMIISQNCDLLQILLPDNLHTYQFALQNAVTHNFIASNTTGIFSPVNPGDYWIYGTRFGCDSSKVSVHVDNFPALQYTVLACDSILAYVPNRTGLTFTLTNAPNGTPPYTVINTTGAFGNIPAGNYTLSANHSYCGHRDTTLSLGNEIGLTLNTPKCDSLVAQAFFPTTNLPLQATYTITRLNTTGIPPVTNTTGTFGSVPLGEYEVVATHVNCGIKRDTLYLGNMPAIVKNKVACDSVVVSLAAPLNNVTYHLTNASHHFFNTTGLFGKIPLGKYYITLSHPYCDTTQIDSVVMGGIPAITAVNKINCDSAIVVLNSSQSNLIYWVMGAQDTFANGTGFFGRLPFGNYKVMIKHPNCGIDSSNIVMGGLGALTATTPICDSIYVSMSGYPNARIDIILTDSAGGNYYNAAFHANPAGFGNLQPNTYKVKIIDEYCGSDSIYVQTGFALPPPTATLVACDTVKAFLANYNPSLISYTLMGVANNGIGQFMNNNSGGFGQLYAGTFAISVDYPNCPSSFVNITTGGIAPPIVAQPTCDSINVTVANHLDNVNMTYILHHQAGTYPDMINNTGIFHHIYAGNYTVIAKHFYCGEDSAHITTGGIPQVTATVPRCDSIKANVPNMPISSILYELYLTGGAVLGSNYTGGFNHLLAGNYTIIAKHHYCGMSTTNVTTINVLPSLVLNSPACDAITANIPNYSNISYHLQGQTNGISLTNTTGNFTGLSPDIYTVTGTHQYCGAVTANRTLSPMPNMSVTKQSCESVTSLIASLGYAGTVYKLHEVNNSYPDLTNTTGIFTPVDWGTYMITAFHTYCGTDTQTVSMGGIPKPTITQYTCDSIRVNLSGYTGITYEVTNGVDSFINSTGYFGGLTPGKWYATAKHLHCGRNRDSIILSNAPISPNYCLRAFSKTIGGNCKFAWRLILSPGQHTFIISNSVTGIVQTVTTTLTYDLLPGTYKIYDPLQCQSVYVNLPQTPQNLDVISVYCPNQGCILASGGKVDTAWASWNVANNITTCAAFNSDKYVLMNPPSGITPVNTTGFYCGLTPGATYEVRLYSQYAHANGGCPTDIAHITLPISNGVFAVSIPPVILCNATATATLNVSVSGMAPPCTFSLLNPPSGYLDPTSFIDIFSTTASFANLPDGVYTFRVSACGQSIIQTGIVQLVPPITPIAEYYCDSTLHLDAPCLNGATYSWTNLSGTFSSAQCENLLNSQVADIFFLTITTPPPTNCTLLNNVQINVPSFANSTPFYPPVTFTSTPPSPIAGIAPIAVTLAPSNLPSNWILDSIYQVAPFFPTALMQNCNVDTSANTASFVLTASDATCIPYYYEVVLRGDFNRTCKLSKDSVCARIPLALYEVDLRAEGNNSGMVYGVNLSWRAKGQMQNGKFQVYRKHLLTQQTELIGEVSQEMSEEFYTYFDKTLPMIVCGDSFQYTVKWATIDGSVVATDAENFRIFPQNAQLYPNPVSDVLNVSFPCEWDFENTQIHLYDEIGKEIVLSKVNYQNQLLKISVKDLAAGSYIISFISDLGTKMTYKFVKVQD